MNKIMLVIVVFAVFTVPAAAQEVYLVPQQSNAAYSSTADVEIWVDAIEFQGGQINLTYNPSCANVTNWMRNTTNFLIGGWSHYNGRVWITFLTMEPQPPLLTGKYIVGTLTIQCVNETGGWCKTPLAFAEPSRLLDDRGDPVTVAWRDGSFRCLASTAVHTSTLTPTPDTNTDSQTTPLVPPTPVMSPVGKKKTPSSSGGTSVKPTLTPTPTSTTSPTLMPAQTPTAAPSPVAIASPLVSPTLTPEGKKELPGFEVVFAILGLLVLLYLKSNG